MKVKQLVISGTVNDMSSFIDNVVKPKVGSNEIAFVLFEQAGTEFLIRGGVAYPIGVALSDDDINTIVANAIKDRPTFAQLPKPIQVSDALSQYIDGIVESKTEKMSPLSDAQIETLFERVLQKFSTDGSGALNISYQLPTPVAKIVTPMNTVTQDTFESLGDGVYRFTFDPTTYGDGNYTIEISMR